jgi:hypothetical protein
MMAGENIALNKLSSSTEDHLKWKLQVCVWTCFHWNPSGVTSEFCIPENQRWWHVIEFVKFGMVPSSVICIRLFGLLSGVAAQFLEQRPHLRRIVDFVVDTVAGNAARAAVLNVVPPVLHNALENLQVTLLHCCLCLLYKPFGRDPKKSRW